jgi:hypothetical protein
MQKIAQVIEHVVVGLRSVCRAGWGAVPTKKQIYRQWWERLQWICRWADYAVNGAVVCSDDAVSLFYLELYVKLSIYLSIYAQPNFFSSLQAEACKNVRERIRNNWWQAYQDGLHRLRCIGPIRRKFVKFCWFIARSLCLRTLTGVIVMFLIGDLNHKNENTNRTSAAHLQDVHGLFRADSSEWVRNRTYTANDMVVNKVAQPCNRQNRVAANQAVVRCSLTAALHEFHCMFALHSFFQLCVLMRFYVIALATVSFR